MFIQRFLNVLPARSSRSLLRLFTGSRRALHILTTFSHILHLAFISQFHSSNAFSLRHSFLLIIIYLACLQSQLVLHTTSLRATGKVFIWCENWKQIFDHCNIVWFLVLISHIRDFETSQDCALQTLQLRWPLSIPEIIFSLLVNVLLSRLEANRKFIPSLEFVRP